MPGPGPWQYYVDSRLQTLVLRQRVTCESGAFLDRVGVDRDQVTVREVEVKVPVWRE